jgi:hypothetical protein
VVAVDRYDEAVILRRLELLTRSSKTAFAGACAERLWPLVERYASAAGVAAAQISALRAGLDAVWRSALGSPEDLASVQALAESLAPKEDDQWVFEVGYGQNAIAAVAYAACTWLTDESQEAVWAARQVYEAADYGAQRQLSDLGAYSADLEDDLRDSSVVRGAVEALGADLEAAAQGDLLGLRDQSRVGAGELAGLFP